MADDPGFIFYPGDYLRDTQCMSEKTQVSYDRIMCEHMRKICITHQQLNFFTKRLNAEERAELLAILIEVPGGFQIKWVAESIVKRLAYSESRRNNRKKKDETVTELSDTYVPHMDNDNENVVKNKDVTVTIGAEKKISQPVKKSQLKFNINDFDHHWKDNDQFMEAFTRFNEMRVSTGHPMTVNACDLIMTELVKLSGADIATAIQILNKSTRSNWRDVFPLKLYDQIQGQGNGAINKQNDAYATQAAKLKQT